jgi:hypothetical protein
VYPVPAVHGVPPVAFTVIDPLHEQVFTLVAVNVIGVGWVIVTQIQVSQFVQVSFTFTQYVPAGKLLKHGLLLQTDAAVG